VGYARGKKPGGRPRDGRWTKTRTEKIRPTSRGGLYALLSMAAILAAGTGAFLWQMQSQLDAGLVKQRAEARRRPDWVAINSLPPHVARAFMAVVDTASFTAATDQQSDDPRLSWDLVRQVHRLGPDIPGQVRAAAMAPLLEHDLSPRERMELYLNRVDLGKTGSWRVYGVGHAAREYFEKDARQLTVGEAATLAGLLLAPRVEEPDGVPGVVGVRRTEVLRRMLETGAIRREDYDAALTQPLAFQPGIEYAPMARPLDWRTPPAVLRLPLATATDSAAASSGPAPSPGA
jgi:membrane peptidoglycan carboxypeptidase